MGQYNTAQVLCELNSWLIRRKQVKFLHGGQSNSPPNMSFNPVIEPTGNDVGAAWAFVNQQVTLNTYNHFKTLSNSQRLSRSLQPWFWERWYPVAIPG